MMRKLINQHRQKIVLLTTALFISVIAFYIYRNWSDFTSMQIQDGPPLLILGFGTIINLYVTGSLMDSILRTFNIHISRKESFGLASITRFINQIMPGKLGFFVRATYLKQKYKFTLTSSVSTIAVAHILMYVISSLLGLMAAFFIARTQTPIPEHLILVLATLLVFMLFLLFLPKIKLPFLQKIDWIKGRQIDFNNGWQSIRKDRKSLPLILLWVLLSILSAAMVVWGAFNALGAEISVVGAIFIASITILNSVIGLTPSGIGVSEGLTVVAGAALGVPVAVSLTAALLKRAFIFTISGPLAMAFSRYLFDKPLINIVRDFSKKN